MSQSESVAMVEAASLEVRPSVTDTAQLAEVRDSRLEAETVTRAARLAVAAWAMAANGDNSALTDIAQPDALYWLMHPVRQHWQVAPGPRVTHIAVSPVDADPPQLRVRFDFTGRRRFDDAREVDVPRGGTRFVGLLTLTFQSGGGLPWQLSSGHVETLDQFLGYVFTSRLETPEECRQRAGSAAGPAAGGRDRAFRLVAGFAEHDERFAATVSVEAHCETTPTPGDAEQLVWPAILAETRRALGDGDWRPALNWLDVVELLDHRDGT
jgi:hypothetical protein